MPGPSGLDRGGLPPGISQNGALGAVRGTKVTDVLRPIARQRDVR